jgi:uncharacterized iron-regulated protein
MLRIISFFIFVFLFHFSNAQSKPAYILYNAKGKKVAYDKMIRDISKKDIVLFGEFHNNPISHWLQLEVSKDLSLSRNLIFGAEMFEADNQEALNNYLVDKISAKGLDSAARLWNNYKTDYAPLVNYAKKIKAPFIATNIPRRFAAMVNKGGFEVLDTLTFLEKSWLAPLPMKFDAELPGYVNILKMMGGHGTPNLIKAQASKDATMAYFILKNHIKGSLSLHFNGAYHSDNFEGILWYLKKDKPDYSYATITTVSQADIKKLLKENKNKANYIICVDEDMTTTY